MELPYIPFLDQATDCAGSLVLFIWTFLFKCKLVYCDCVWKQLWGRSLCTSWRHMGQWKKESANS